MDPRTGLLRAIKCITSFPFGIYEVLILTIYNRVKSKRCRSMTKVRNKLSLFTCTTI